MSFLCCNVMKYDLTVTMTLLSVLLVVLGPVFAWKEIRSTSCMEVSLLKRPQGKSASSFPCSKHWPSSNLTPLTNTKVKYYKRKQSHIAGMLKEVNYFPRWLPYRHDFGGNPQQRVLHQTNGGEASLQGNG